LYVLCKVCQIAKGLMFLNTTLNIAHLNLKPQNIFIYNKEKLKLSDIFLFEPTKNNFVSNDYTAPECKQGDYSYPADIWSLGVILWEMAHVPDDVIHCGISNVTRRTSLPAKYCDISNTLLAKLTAFNPCTRPTPFFIETAMAEPLYQMKLEKERKELEQFLIDSEMRLEKELEKLVRDFKNLQQKF
jgi:serine/threonine protein kinase